MADIPKISGRDPRTIVSTRFALRVKKDSGIVLSPADEGELRMLDTIISKLIDERPATATAPATAVPRPGINPAFKFGVDIICKALNATKPQPMEILAAAARPSPPQPTRRVPPPTVVAVAAAAAAATAIKPAHEIRLVDSTTRAPDAIKKPLALPMPREAPSAAAATDIAHQFAEANEVLTPLEFARHHNLAVLFNTVTDWSPEDVAECDGEGPPTLDTRARRAFAVAKKRQMEFVREFETLTDYLDHDIVIDPLLKLYHEEHPDLVETCKEEIKAARGNDDVNSATAELKKLILTHAITSPVETYITSRDRALFECLSKSYPQLAPKFREIGVTDMSVSALSELPDDVKTKLHMLSATFLQHDRQLAAAFSRIESVAPKMIEWEAAHPQLIQQQKWALAQDILEHPDRTVAEANKQLRAFIIAQLPSPTLPPPVNLHQKGIPAAGLPLKMATDKTPFRSYIDAAAKADIEAAHRKCQGTIRAAIQTTAGNPQTLKTTTFKAHDELMTNVSSAYYHLVGRYSGNPAAAGCAEALSAYERQLLRFDISRDENDKAINGWRTSLFESAPAADSNKGEGGVVDYYVGFRRHDIDFTLQPPLGNTGDAWTRDVIGTIHRLTAWTTASVACEQEFASLLQHLEDLSNERVGAIAQKFVWPAMHGQAISLSEYVQWSYVTLVADPHIATQRWDHVLRLLDQLIACGCDDSGFAETVEAPSWALDGPLVMALTRFRLSRNTIECGDTETSTVPRIGRPYVGATAEMGYRNRSLEEACQIM